MTGPVKVPGPLKLRITAACTLCTASFAVVANPGSPVAAAVALADAVVAGVCLWLAYWLGQVNKGERRPKD